MERTQAPASSSRYREREREYREKEVEKERLAELRDERAMLTRASGAGASSRALLPSSHKASPPGSSLAASGGYGASASGGGARGMRSQSPVVATQRRSSSEYYPLGPGHPHEGSGALRVSRSTRAEPPLPVSQSSAPGAPSGGLSGGPSRSGSTRDLDTAATSSAGGYIHRVGSQSSQRRHGL